MAHADDLAAINLALVRITRVGNSAAGRRRIEERSGVSLGSTAIAVLAAVVRVGPARVGAIAEQADLHQPRVSQELRTLAELRYVTQSPDPADRRAALIVATPEGKDAYERYLDAAVAGVADLVARWPKRDVSHLAELLTRLAGEFSSITDPRV